MENAFVMKKHVMDGSILTHATKRQEYVNAPIWNVLVMTNIALNWILMENASNVEKASKRALHVETIKAATKITVFALIKIVSKKD